jgi:hypothetical protein
MNDSENAGDQKFTLNSGELNSILNDARVKDVPVCLISVAG